LANLKRGYLVARELGAGKAKICWNTSCLKKTVFEYRHLVITGTCSAKNSPLFKIGIYRVK
jgi:hypothetical protein